MPASWDLEADVVIIGAGATGLPAAIKAVDEGVSVIVVEANYDVGGHAILSRGNVPLGGGTSAQRKYGIEDSPDLVFADLTDWSIVQPNGWPDYRYNDRAVMRAFADHCAATYEFLVANGVKFKEIPPTMLVRTARATLHRVRIMRSGPTARGPRVQAAEAERVWCGHWRRARGPRESNFS
jgi:succinate dehydrogenase/fumarate reductase flavoprotein subunit